MQFKRNWISFKTIVRREARRFFRLWIQTILPSAVTCVLYLVIFGNFIGSRVGEIEGYPYIQFIIPGLIMMAVVNNAYANVVSSFFGAKFGRHIEELLVSPTSNSVILMGYVIGGILRGWVVGLVIWGISMIFSPIPIQHPILMLFVIFSTACLFSLAGFINAIFAKTFDNISIIPTFILMPLTYFGGVFYSIENLPVIWQKISLVNPILYMINLFRYSLLGVSDISVYTALTVLLSLTVILFCVARELLNRGVGLRA